MRFAFFSILLLLLYSASFIQTECVAEQCSGCCNNGNCLNTTDISRCELSKNYDFNYLINTLITLASFIIGFPLILYVIDFLVMKRIFCSKSFCEIIANYFCCCFCVGRRKKKPENSKKFVYNKISPSNMV